MAKKEEIKKEGGVIEKLKKIASNIAFIYTTIATIIGLVTTIIIYINKTTSQESRIHHLEESNKRLEGEVYTLKGALDGVNNAVKIFLTNSPDLLNYKIDEISKRIDNYHGNSSTNSSQPTSQPTNRIPGR